MAKRVENRMEFINFARSKGFGPEFTRAELIKFVKENGISRPWWATRASSGNTTRTKRGTYYLAELDKQDGSAAPKTAAPVAVAKPVAKKAVKTAPVKGKKKSLSTGPETSVDTGSTTSTKSANSSTTSVSEEELMAAMAEAVGGV